MAVHGNTKRIKLTAQQEARERRLEWAMEQYLQGIPRYSLGRRIMEHFGIPRRTADRDAVDLFRKKMPSIYSQTELGERVDAAVARADEAHRVAWDELRSLLRGDYDYTTSTGTRRPPSAPYVQQIVATQRHLAELTGASSAGQIWQDRKKIEQIKAGALQQMMAEIDQMSDDQIRVEALRIAAERGSGDTADAE